MGFYIWIILLGIFFVLWIALGCIVMLWYDIQRYRKGNVEWINKFWWWMTVSVVLLKGCRNKLDTIFVIMFSPAAVFSGLLLLSVELVESPWKMKLMNEVPVVGKQINRWVLCKSTGLEFPLFDVEDVHFHDCYPDYTLKVKLVLEDSPSKKKVLETIKEMGNMRIGDTSSEQLVYYEELWVDNNGNLFYSFNK